jgi:hypothetical protein
LYSDAQWVCSHVNNEGEEDIELQLLSVLNACWTVKRTIARRPVSSVPGCICLLCTSGTAHMRGPGRHVRKKGCERRERESYIFPPQGSTTFAAIYISDGVIPSGHRAVIRFTFNDIDTMHRLLDERRD